MSELLEPRNCDDDVSSKMANTPPEGFAPDKNSFIPKWLTYLVVITFWACSGYFSLVVAALSINVVVIGIFLASVIFSLIVTVTMVSRKVWLAYVSSVAHIPVGFLFSYLYYQVWGK